MITKILIILLMLDAACVAIGQVRKLNVWPLICAYWIILTVKNAIDAVGVLR